MAVLKKETDPKKMYTVREAGLSQGGGNALLRALIRPYMTINSPNLGDYGGATYGPVSTVHPDASPEEVGHEQRHGQQFYVPGWMMLKVLDAMYPHGEGPLERDADAAGKIPRGAGDPGLVNRLAMKYMSAFIGKPGEK